MANTVSDDVMAARYDVWPNLPHDVQIYISNRYKERIFSIIGGNDFEITEIFL